MVQKLNTTFQQDIKEEAEALALFFRIMSNAFVNKKVDLTAPVLQQSIRCQQQQRCH